MENERKQHRMMDVYVCIYTKISLEFDKFPAKYFNLNAFYGVQFVQFAKYYLPVFMNKEQYWNGTRSEGS